MTNVAILALSQLLDSAAASSGQTLYIAAPIPLPHNFVGQLYAAVMLGSVPIVPLTEDQYISLLSDEQAVKTTFKLEVEE